MKRIIDFLIILLFPFFIFSENFSLNGSYIPDLYSTVDEVILEDNTLTFRYEIDFAESHFQYQKKYIDGLLFLELSKTIPKEFSEDFYYYHNDFKPDNKLLIIAGKELNYKYLQGKDVSMTERVLLFASTTGFEEKSPFIYEMFRFTERIGRQYTDCSSYLKERTKEYPVTNLDQFNVDTPWVEGVEGDGIGEGFTIKNQYVYPYLLIMNGYISYKKPYLYKQNGRVKKIKVTGVNSGKSKVLDVLDTQHPQTVDISFLNEPEDIRVEIADVYKGTKYDDTCLHFCVTYTNEVIPYEDSIGE